MAAFSFSFLVPACVGRTRLIHRHSLAARLLDFLACGLFLRKEVCEVSPRERGVGTLASPRGILSVRDIFMERGVLFPRERGVFVEHARSVPT
jgi:hypothetical protein